MRKLSESLDITKKSLPLQQRITFKTIKEMEKKEVTALERFKTALKHKQEVKQQIIAEYAAKGQRVDVVFL